MIGVFRPKKKIVYLDQNFLSNIAKASLKPKLSVYQDIWKTLLSLIEADRIACPSSEFHEEETLYCPAPLRDKLRRVAFALSGGLGFRSWLEILESQTLIALHEYMGKPHAGMAAQWRQAFQSDPDAPGAHGHRKADYADRSPFLALLRQTKYSYPDEARRIASDLRSRSISFDDRFEYEMGAFVHHFILKPLASSMAESFKARSGRPFDVAELLPLFPTTLYRMSAELGCDIDDFLRFLLSKEFKAIPFVHIFCSLHAVMVTTSTRPEPGDSDDVMMLATVVPYSNVVATDHSKKRLFEELGLDRQYGVKLFSAKQQQIQDFSQLLRDVLAQPGSDRQAATNSGSEGGSAFRLTG